MLEAPQGDNYSVHSQSLAGDCFYLQSFLIIDREIEIQAMKSTQFKGSFVGISESSWEIAEYFKIMTGLAW